MRGPERKVVTVLFADVVGSTDLGESLDPEQLDAILRDYFETMRATVLAHGGVVEKFIGDAVVAVFGIPSTREDDAARALRCALEMQRALTSVNERVGPHHGVMLAMRIGVSTGEVITAQGQVRGEPLVAGDVMNLAARLQVLAEPGHIVVSRRSARAAREPFAFRSLGELTVRGRSEPVGVFELSSMAPRSPASDATPRALARPPLLGREDALDRLVAALGRVRRSAAPHMVTVLGDAGIGKSRLASEFEARVAGTALVLTGACVPPGEGPPLGPFGQILSRIGELAAPDAAQREQLASVLRASVGMTGAKGSPELLPPRQLRYETGHAWRRTLETLAAERPVVLIVDDLHWADPSLLDLLETLADRVQGPVLFVCLARPDLAERGEGWGAGWPNHTMLELQPLAEPDAARLVMALLGPDPPQLPFLAEVLAAAEGNPFFLEELVAELADRGVLEAAGSSWRAVSGPVRVEVPDTIQAVLATRIDALGPADKAVLHAASVLGRDVTVDAVARVLPGEPPEVRRGLDRLVERGLMEAGDTIDAPRSAGAGPSYRFRHALTREVAYAAVPRRDRCVAHDRAADRLQELGGGGRGVADAIAHHRVAALSDTQAAGSGATERTARRSAAFQASLRASEGSRRGGASAAAMDHASRAVTLAGDDRERAAALEALGRAQLGGFGRDDAWASLAAALELRLADRPTESAGPDRALAQLAASALEAPTRWGMSTPPPRAVAERYLAVGLAAAGEGDSEERVRLLAAQALLPIALADAPQESAVLELSRVTAETAAEMAERLDRPELASAALDAVCLFLYSLGRYGEMRRFVERRLALIPTLTDIGEIQDSYAMAAWCAFHLGEYREARAFADLGIVRVAEVDPALAIHCRIWRSAAALRLGDWDAVLAEHEELTRLAGPAPTSGRGALPALAEALVHDRRGDEVGADDLIRSVGREAIFTERGIVAAPDDADPGEPERDVPWVARLLSERGLHERALVLLRVPTRSEHRENLGLILEARCDVIGDGEAWHLAPDAIEAARAYARDTGSRVLSAHADRLGGRLASAHGQFETAHTLLAQAASGFGHVDDPYLGALTTFELAMALGRSGLEGDAAERAVESYRALDRLHARRPIGSVVRFLERLGVGVPEPERA